MATVNVLMAVDVEGALSSNNLGANVYMVDTNKYAGSGAEGTSELRTKLNIGDIIVWTVAPIDPATNVEISSFSGTAVTDKYIIPVQDPLSHLSFESFFQPPGGTPSDTSFQYSITLSFEGNKEMTFDPFLIVE